MDIQTQETTEGIENWTHSDVASQPDSNESASQIARSDPQSFAWQTGAKITLIQPNLNTHTHAVDLIKAAKRVPRWLIDKSHDYHFSRWSSIGPLYDALSRPPEEMTFVDDFPEEDSDSLSKLLPTVMPMCIQLRKFSKSNSEATLRSHIDVLVSTLVNLLQPQLYYDLECSLWLPWSKGFTIKSAVADAVLWFEKSWPDIIETDLWEEANCLEAHLYRTSIKVVVWASEYKATLPASNQLAYDLGAAQYQRRALGFRDHSIYGAAFTGSIATLHVSFWSGTKLNQIAIEEIGQYNLAEPYGAIQFINFLRVVMRYYSTLAPAMATITIDGIKTANKQYKKFWQARKNMPPPNPPNKKKNSRGREAMDLEIWSNSNEDPVKELCLVEGMDEVCAPEDAYGVEDNLDAWERMGLEERDTITEEVVEAWRHRVAVLNKHPSNSIPAENGSGDQMRLPREHQIAIGIPF